MPLNEVRLHLTHRIEHDAHNDQQTCATEELRCDHGHVQTLAEKAWHNRYHRQKNRAGKREPRHREIEKVRSRFAWPDTWNITAVFF